MLYLLLVFAVSIFNLAMGYCTAVLLGFCPRLAADGSQLAANGRCEVSASDRSSNASSCPGGMIAPREEITEQSAVGSNGCLPESPPESSGIDRHLQSGHSSEQDPAVELSIAVATADMRLASLQGEFEKREKQGNSAPVDACLQELMGTCQYFLSALRWAMESNTAEIHETRPALDKRFEELAVQQLAQLETLSSNLTHKHSGLDPSQMLHGLEEETRRIRSGLAELQDRLNAVG